MTKLDHPEVEAEILDARVARRDSRALWPAGPGQEHGGCRVPGLPGEPGEVRG